MVNAIKEGLQNFVKFSDEYNKVMSDFKSQTAELKNNLASAFAPIIETIIPYLTRMVEVLNAAVDKMAQFFNALQGKGYYAKAKKQLIDYASTVDATKNKLASFDDINVLSNGTGGELTGANAFETAEIEDNVLRLSDIVTELIKNLKDDFSGWWSSLDFNPLVESFTRLKDSAMPIIEGIGNAFTWVRDNAIKPFYEWMISIGIPPVFDTLATALETIKTVIDELMPSLTTLWNDLIVPIADFLGDVFLITLTLIQTALTDISTTVTEKAPKINNILQILARTLQVILTVLRPIVQMLLGMVSGALTLIIHLVGNLLSILSDFLSFFVLLFTGDIKGALKSLGNMFIGLCNLIIEVFEDVINTIVRGINSISFDVPGWIPGIGGTHVGFDLKEITLAKIPEIQLATGGITNRPTTALIGENGREAVLPLENNTEWMDELASRLGSGTTVIKFEGSLSQLARVLKPVLDNENSRIGTNLVVEG